MKLKSILILLLLLLSLLTGNSMAAAPANLEREPQLGGLILGIGGMYRTSPYRGVDDEVQVFPQISYRGDRFSLFGPRLSYNFYKKGPLNLGILGSYKGQGYDSGDSLFLQGMADRHSTFEGGITASLHTPYGLFSGSLLTDLLDQHQGQQARLGWSKGYRMGRLMLSPSVSLTWQSRRLADYYYGVESDEATPVRPAYQVGSPVNMSGSLRANYLLTQHWMLIGQVALEKLGHEISKSPIVGEDVVTSGYLGVGYRF